MKVTEIREEENEKSLLDDYEFMTEEDMKAANFSECLKKIFHNWVLVKYSHNCWNDWSCFQLGVIHESYMFISVCLPSSNPASLTQAAQETYQGCHQILRKPTQFQEDWCPLVEKKYCPIQCWSTLSQPQTRKCDYDGSMMYWTLRKISGQNKLSGGILWGQSTSPCYWKVCYMKSLVFHLIIYYLPSSVVLRNIF